MQWHPLVFHRSLISSTHKTGQTLQSQRQYGLAAAEEDIETIEDWRENIPSLSVYVYLMIDLIASWIAFMNSRSLKQGTLSL
jgi:hypothetical protein